MAFKNPVQLANNLATQPSKHERTLNRIKELYKPYFNDQIPDDFEFMNLNFDDLNDDEIEKYISSLNPEEDYKQWKMGE